MQNYYLPFAFWKISQIRANVSLSRLCSFYYFSLGPHPLPPLNLCGAAGTLHAVLGSFLSGRVFGSKALETGAFRAAWAPVMSLTESKIWTHLLRTKFIPSEKPSVELYASWTLLPRLRFAFPPVRYKTMKAVIDPRCWVTGRSSTTPRLFSDVVTQCGSLSGLLAWVFFT